MPEDGLYLWEWFFHLIATSGKRIVEGKAHPLSNTDIRSWIELSGEIVTSAESDALIKMSVVWANAMDEELENVRAIERNKEERKKNA